MEKIRSDVLMFLVCNFRSLDGVLGLHSLEVKLHLGERRLLLCNDEVLFVYQVLALSIHSLLMLVLCPRSNLVIFVCVRQSGRLREASTQKTAS